ncbi:Gfo/Idh/MocA family protein [Brachybacterium sp. GCM10030267]|uniref:Gfo/Idh/MocA family protein n=1 Tax=unclassified Brachybacterium TaxID=2623841 RepID=UPI00361C0D28
MTSTSPPAAPLRVGVIGTGGISRAHAPGWIEAGAELHCYSLQGAPAFAEEFGARVHESLESILAAVDAVDICTPTPDHGEIVHRALDAGKDVVCEKPLTLTPEDARSVLEHAERVGRLLLPAHVVRFFPQYAAAKAAIDTGAVGRLAVLRFERTGSFPTQPWFGDESRSGGIVMDQMIHDIDQAIWMAGPVGTVYARQSTATETDTVRTAHVILTHTSGAISHCRGLWGPPGTQFRYTFDLAGDVSKLQYDSAGDSPVIFDEVASARQRSGDGYLPDVAAGPSPYVEEILEFAAAIRDGGPSRVSAADGAYAVEVSSAALESLRTGGSVTC